MSKKPTFDEIHDLYSKYMIEQSDKFFEVSGSGWTVQEYSDYLLSEQKMILEYNQIVKPLIDRGLMFLN